MKDVLMSGFSNILPDIRQREQLTVEHFAYFLLVTRESYLKWESGERIPDYKTLMELSMKLNIPVENLIDQSPTPTND